MGGRVKDRGSLSRVLVRFSTYTAFTLALRTVPARFGLSQHGYDRECKRVITVPCRAGPARVYIRGLARYGTVVAASVNANRAGERFSVSTSSLVTSISPCYCSIALVLTLAQSKLFENEEQKRLQLLAPLE